MSKFEIKYHYVFRDAIQSLFGTNPSADEMLAVVQHAHEIGVDKIQSAGGTFFDIFAKKGRNEWAELDKITGFFKDNNVTQTALIRGDFLFGYEPQPYDVIKATVFEMAQMGITILQSFHGLNDAQALAGVSQAVQEAKTAGHSIKVQGVICIENNKNITLESCLAHAEDLMEMGHEGFYLKSASGVVDPKFVEDLTTALYDKYPDQEIKIHVHSTYGCAEASYMAAIRAAKAAEKPISIDVQTPAFAGPTSHPSITNMQDLIESDEDPDICAAAPQINRAAIDADEAASLEMRMAYQDFETSPTPKLLKAMKCARAPGGASSTLKSIPGLVENLGRLLGTNDWNEIQIAIYDMQADILDDLGDPTQVTPYAANTTGQAAISLYSTLIARAQAQKDNPAVTDAQLDDIGRQARYSNLYPGLVNYLVGRHGKIPSSANKDLQAKALEKLGLNEVVKFIPAIDKPQALLAAKAALQEQGIAAPTQRQQISAAILKDGVAHVLACARGKNTPQAPTALPRYTQASGAAHTNQNGIELKSVKHAVEAVGGAAALQKLAEHVAALYHSAHGINAQLPKEIVTQWDEARIAAIQSFMRSLEEKLELADFDPVQINAQTQDIFHADSYAAGHNTLYAAIRNTLNRKGDGLHDFMQDIVERSSPNA